MISPLLLVFATAVGFVHSPVGKVTLDGAPVTGLARALDKAVLTVGPRGQATYVSRGKGLRFRLVGPYQGRCTADGLRDVRGRAVPLGALAAIARGRERGDLGSSAGIVVRADETSASFSGLFPFGLVRPAGWTVRWEGSLTVDEFLVRISEEDADEETWSRTVPGSGREAVLDARLTPGRRYVLSVAAKRGGKIVADVESRLEACDEPTSVALSSIKGGGEAMAELLEACGLLAEAADEYEKVGTDASKARAVELRKPGRVKS